MANRLVWWADPNTGVEGLLWTDNGPDPDDPGDGTRQGLTDDLNCCCTTSGCACASICSQPHWRVSFQLPGASDCIGGIGACFQSASYTGTMTEYFVGDPEWAPDPQPPTVAIVRYWRATADIGPCGDPDPVRLELCCVGSDEKRYMRLNGDGAPTPGVWRDVGDPDCNHYWTIVSVLSTEIAVTAAPGCCGTTYVEMWCGGTPDLPECDLAGTGPDS